MVGTEYLLTTDVSTCSFSPVVSIFVLVPVPDSLLHQSPHLLVHTQQQQFSSNGLATPRDLWEPFRRSGRSNLLNSKKLCASCVHTVEDSFHRLHDLWNHSRLNKKGTGESRGLLLTKDIREICKAIFPLNLFCFRKYIQFFFSLKIQLRSTWKGLILLHF